MPPLLQVSDLRTHFFTFGGTRVVKAVDGVSVRVGEGDFFGEFSLLLHTSHSKIARTLVDSELMVLPKESLQELLEGNPELHDHFRRKVEQRFPESLSKLS